MNVFAAAGIGMCIAWAILVVVVLASLAREHKRPITEADRRFARVDVELRKREGRLP